MKRRHFLKTALAAGVAAHWNYCGKGDRQMKVSSIPRRKYNDDVSLSIIGFGGIVVVGLEQKDANQMVVESIERGVNYFDVAPTYGNGEAEEKLGIALRPYRKEVFLACKTTERDARGAQKELEQSLRTLHTDYFDLYQFHGVTTMEDVENIWAPGGAAETFIAAREQGKVRFLGFSAHSEQAALAMLERFEFDSILFPINFVCYAQGDFGPQVVRRAKEKGVTLLALKAMAHHTYAESDERIHPKCWYRPVTDPELARQALRFTLSEGVTAAIPPGDERLFRLALSLAGELDPIAPGERQQLVANTQGLQPIFHS